MKSLNYKKSITYSELRTKPSHWIVGEKLDGVFAHVDGNRIVSRECIDFPGFDEIIKQVQKVMSLGGFNFIQGELYDPNKEFHDIQGRVRSGTAPIHLKDSICLYIFHAGGSFKSTRQMMHNINQAVRLSECNRIKIIPSKIISDKEVEQTLNNAVNLGAEGIVLRHLKCDIDNQIGFVKLKPYIENDFKVMTILEGTGKNIGKMGSMTLSGTVNNYRVVTKVGSGISVELRDWFWANRNNIENSLIVEIKHDGLQVRPNSDGIYALRNASFVKTKEDRT